MICWIMELLMVKLLSSLFSSYTSYYGDRREGISMDHIYEPKSSPDLWSSECRGLLKKTEHEKRPIKQRNTQSVHTVE